MIKAGRSELLPNHFRPLKANFESMMRVDLILHIISEDLEDEDLLSYMTLSRDMYRRVMENTKIQLRIMNAKLLHTQIEIQCLKDDPNCRQRFRQQKKKKQSINKWLKDFHTSSQPTCTIPTSPTITFDQLPRSFLVSSILFGNIPHMTAAKSSTQLEQPKYDDYSVSQPEPIIVNHKNNLKIEDTIVNKSHQLPIEFEDYTKFLESTDKVSANQSSGLDGTNQGASTRNTIINVKASISQLPTISPKAFCPVVLARTMISKVQDIIY